MQRETYTAPVLTLVRGGTRPEELREAIEEAESKLRVVVQALPPNDRLKRPLGLLADALKLRLSTLETN